MADKISWIDAKGVERIFDTDIVVLKGMNGRFMPPISFIEEAVPYQHGSRLRQVTVEPRDVDIPIYINGKNEIELRKKMREITRIFNPLKADGRLKVIAPDGSQRELFCRYSTGLEGNEDIDSKGLYWQTLILVFRAFDPFWYDSITKVFTFKKDESKSLFFPILPLRLSSSSVFTDVTVDNTGDVETYPEWIITGPGENIVLRNMTTDEVTSLDYSLEAGESIVINTSPKSPNEKTVKKNDGTNLFYTLSDTSSLWALQEGTNGIRLEMSNATSESSIQLSYKPRYWSV